MQTAGEKLIRLSKRAIWFVITLVIGYLLIASVFSTCYLGTIKYSTMSGEIEFNSEHTFYMRDNVWIHLLLFIAFSVFLTLYARKAHKRFLDSKVIGWAAVFLMTLIAVYIVLAGAYEPSSDQKHVVDAAMAFYMGDYSELEPGGYIFLNPHQFGILLFYWGLCILFGGLNNVGFQLVNVALIVLSYIVLAKLCGLIMLDDKDRSGHVLAVSALFLPYLFYATYLYGTVVGFLFAILAYYSILLFLKKGKLFLLTVGCICMAAAVLVRSNYLIFLVAALICLMGGTIENIKNRKMVYRGLLCGILMVGSCLVIKWGANGFLTYLNGGDKVEGLPMITYVAMGLQDGKCAPGWYNVYNYTVYVENQFIQENTIAAAKEKIIDIVRQYPQNITASVSFFIKKIVSQWNNPTYGSLAILDERIGSGGLNWLLNEGIARYIYLGYVNLIHTWILTGSFLYMVMRIKKNTWRELLLPLTFLGGFLFHLVWEAKTTYAISYVLLLIPLCIWGYRDWYICLCNHKVSCKKAVLCGMGVVFLCLISRTELFAKTFARNDDDGIFNVYTQEIVDQDQLSVNS